MLFALLVVLAAPHTFTVPGLTCPTCEDPVRSSLALTDGVTKVLVDWRTQSVTVEFDEELTSISALAKVLGNSGFPAKSSKVSAPSDVSADVQWMRPRGALASNLVAGKSTVFAFTTSDCAPCDVLKNDLTLLAQRTARVAIRFIKLEGQDDPLFSMLPKNPSVPYAFVFGAKGVQHYAGTPTKGGGEVYQAIEDALGINPDGSPKGEDAP